MDKTRYVRWLETPVWSGPESLQRYLSLGCLISLAIACYHAVTVPAVSGYTPSLATAFPLEFWIGFYATFALGCAMIGLSLRNHSTTWKHGFLFVICDYSILFFLPVARGYHLYGRGAADILRHLGDAKGILSSGMLQGSWYPAVRVLFAQLSLAGVPLNRTMYPLGLLFTLLFIFGVGLLVNLESEASIGLVSGLFVSLPLIFTTFHLSMHPAVLSLFLLPVALFVLRSYQRTNLTRYLALFVVFSLLLTVFHPMTMVLLVVLTFSTSVFNHVYWKSRIRAVSPLSPRIGMLTTVPMYMWLVHFNRQQVESNLQRVVNAWLTNAASPAEQEAQKIAAFTPVGLILQTLELYGTQLAYIGIAGLITAAVGYRLFFTNRDMSYCRSYYAFQFTIGAAIAVVFLTGYFIERNPIRVSRYMLMMATILIGGVLASLNRKSIAQGLVIFLVISAGVLSVNAVHEPNHHLTESELAGVSYTGNHQNTEPVYSHKISNKMEEYALGSTNPQLYPTTFSREYGLPRNLGYTGNDTAGATFGDGYVVTKEFDREYYNTPYFSESQRDSLFVYNESHLERLQNDQTAGKVYTNGDFITWRTQI